MASRFGWVDFAEGDRQKMLDVVGLFKEKETRDELGIGTIRDAFADYFFPGTSTIQTRIKYMLFVPWIYQNLEAKRVSSAKISDRARQDEVRLIYSLLNSDDTTGVIGKEAKRNLQRLPSNIYWTGLDSWGIRLFPGNQGQYHRQIDTFYYQLRHTQLNDDGEPIGGTSNHNWDPGLPIRPDDLFDNAHLTLSKAEAEYLQDRIRFSHRDSLLAYLVSEDHLTETYFLWQHPVIERVPPKLRQEVKHSQNFSEAIYGAALLYNLFLAKNNNNERLIEEFQERFTTWADDLGERWDSLADWYQNIADFWSTPPLSLTKIPHTTRSFVDEWLRLVFTNGSRLDTLIENKDAYNLIRNREMHLKRARARLDNPRALERWPGHSGDVQLDYRWYRAQVLSEDIRIGLNS